MFCASEESEPKKDNFTTEYTNLVGRKEYSDIEATIKNYFKTCQNNQHEDFESSISYNLPDNISNIGFMLLESNLNMNEEKEEDINIYYHTLDTIDNKNGNMLFKIPGQEYSLFKKDENVSDDKTCENSNFRNNIRYKDRQPRYMNNDNVRRIIKRRFFNTYLKKALNKKLKQLGYKELFNNFPQKLVGEIAKKKNKELMNMTLLQIFEINDFYINKDLINYEHNLNIIKKIKTDEKGEIYFILNKNFGELFEEFINSDEFKEEIGRINSKHENEEFYLKRYAYLAKNFVQFYLQ